MSSDHKPAIFGIMDIQTHLEDGLSELIITSSLKEKDVIQVSLNKEKGELEMKVIAS